MTKVLCTCGHDVHYQNCEKCFCISYLSVDEQLRGVPVTVNKRKGIKYV